MTSKRFFTFLGLLGAFLFLVVFTGEAEPLFPYSGGELPKPGPHAPVITHSFAVDKGNYGYIWRMVFPFTFELVQNPYQYKLPVPFDRGDLPRLGYVGGCQSKEYREAPLIRL